MASTSDIPVLVRRLRSPRRLEQLRAAEALAPLLPGDVAALQALVAAGGGAALARMAVSGSSQAGQRAAARAVNAAVLTALETMGDLAVQLAGQAAGEVADSIPALLALLQSNNSELQEAAAWLVGGVASFRPELRSAVVDAGGLTALLGCLHQHAVSGDRPPECCFGHCALALGMLCYRNVEVQRAVAAGGGAALLESLVASSNAAAHLAAAQALQWLVEGCLEGQQAAAAAGAVPALSQLLASSTRMSANIAATRTLLALRQYWSAHVQQVACSIPGLVRILQHGPVEVSDRQAACTVLYRIHCFGGPAELRAMAAAGAAPALQHFLTLLGRGDAAAGHAHAASALLDALNRAPDR